MPEQLVEQPLGGGRVGDGTALLEVRDPVCGLPVKVSRVAIIARRIAVMSSREAVGRNPSASIRSWTTSIFVRAARRAGRGARRPENGDDQPGVLEDLQGHEIQPVVGASGQAVDRGVVMVGVAMQFRHRRADVAVRDVGCAHVEQIGQHGHAALVGVVEVDPDEAVGGRDGLSDVLGPDIGDRFVRKMPDPHDYPFRDSDSR